MGRKSGCGCTQADMPLAKRPWFVVSRFGAGSDCRLYCVACGVFWVSRQPYVKLVPDHPHYQDHRKTKTTGDKK